MLKTKKGHFLRIPEKDLPLVTFYTQSFNKTSILVWVQAAPGYDMGQGKWYSVDHQPDDQCRQDSHHQVLWHSPQWGHDLPAAGEWL